jgi:hypothetical protein
VAQTAGGKCEKRNGVDPLARWLVDSCMAMRRLYQMSRPPRRELSHPLLTLPLREVLPCWMEVAQGVSW